MLNPFGPIGQGTEAYVCYRQPYAVAGIILQGEDDPVTGQEYEAARGQLQELALIAGFTSSDFPDRSEPYRRHWDQVLANATPEPVPTGRDVAGATLAAAHNAAVNGLRKSAPSPGQQQVVIPNKRDQLHQAAELRRM